MKRGLKWSDGTPFTAADVIFTWEFVTNPEVGSTSASSYEAIASMEVIDDYTVKINFKDVNPAWSDPFVGSGGAILPRHQFEKFKGANARASKANLMPVGTGPYLTRVGFLQ